MFSAQASQELTPSSSSGERGKTYERAWRLQGAAEGEWGKRDSGELEEEYGSACWALFVYMSMEETRA